MDNKVSLKNPYETLVQYVPKKTLNNIFDSLPDQQGAVQVANALKSGNWKKIGETKNFIGYALLALKKGLISVGQFATTSLFWSAKQYHKEVRVVHLFEGSKRNEQAVKTVAATFKILPTFFAIQAKVTDRAWTSDKEEADFFKRIGSRLGSEQCFFVVKDLQGRRDQEVGKDSLKDIADILRQAIRPSRTISQAVRQDSSFNVFNRFGENQRMIPSFGMMQTYVDVVGGKDAVALEPVIGVVPVEHIIKDGDRGTRVMSLPFPGMPFPKTADEYDVPQEYDFTWHDFYHARTASMVPPQHRKAFIAVARVIQGLKDKAKSPKEGEFCQEWFERLIDMEHVQYTVANLPSKKSTMPTGAVVMLFWQTLQITLFYGALSRMTIRELRKTVSDTDMQNHLALISANKRSFRKSCSLVSDRQLPRKVLGQILDEVNFTKYGISLKSLAELGKAVQEQLEPQLSQLKSNSVEYKRGTEINLLYLAVEMLKKRETNSSTVK